MKRKRNRGFKAGHHRSMDDIHAMGDLNAVTRGGASVESKEPGLFDFMSGEFTVAGDVESPLLPLKDWKILQK